MHTVVPGWFGVSSVWFIPLIWRLVRSVLPGGTGLRGPGSIRLWVGFVCVLLASCTLEAALIQIDGFNALGHALAGLGRLAGHPAASVAAMAALFFASLPWLLDFRWLDVLAWADASLGLGLRIGARRGAARAAEHDVASAVGLGSAKVFDARTTLDGSPRRRPTVWRPPARSGAPGRTAGAMVSGAATGAAAASERAKREAASSWRVEPRLANGADALAGAVRSEPVAPNGWLRQPAATPARAQAAPAWANDARRPAAAGAGTSAGAGAGVTSAAGAAPLPGSRTGSSASLAVAAATAAQRAQALASANAAARTERAVPSAEPLTSPFASPAPVRRSAPPPVAGSTAARAAASAPPPRPPKPPRPFVWSGQPARTGLNGTAAQPGMPAATAPLPSLWSPVGASAGAEPPEPLSENALETLRAIEENAARWTTLAGASLARRVNAEALAANVHAANGANTGSPGASAVASPLDSAAASRDDGAATGRAALRQTGAATPQPSTGHALHDVAAPRAPAVEPVPSPAGEQGASTGMGTLAAAASSMPSASPLAPASMSRRASDNRPPIVESTEPATRSEAALPATMPPYDAPFGEPPTEPAWPTNSDELPPWTLLDDEPYDDTEATSEPADEAKPLPAFEPSAPEPAQRLASTGAREDVPAPIEASEDEAWNSPMPAAEGTEEADTADWTDATLAPFSSAAPAEHDAAAGSNIVRFPRIIPEGQRAPAEEAAAQSAPIAPDTPLPTAAPSAAATPDDTPLPPATPPPAISLAPWIADTAAPMAPETAAPWDAPASTASPAAACPPAAPGPDATPSAPRAPVRGHAPTSFVFEPLSASPVELPGLDLLERASADIEPVPEERLAETSQLIEQRLQEFKVPVTVVGASAGPVITRFEVEPALGVRGSQIVGLMKDLSRGLGLTSIRVVETIPGKTCMGLELPNARRQTIRLSEILESVPYERSPSKLTIAMGKDIVGLPVVTDLAKAPHMLVAGTTGSGKSVAINAMILSLLYKATPEDVRLIMIDPKMLELSVYEGIPHLLAPVVTDMKLAANALNWCVGEMEKRYRLMSAVGVRNLAGFNQKLRDAEAHGKKIGNPFSLTPDAPEPLAPLPMIVVVIDELADLMMVAGKKIEELIARLAQKARAAGIHLILATQRPSVDVITGLIKANIPTRVAFQVSSKIDSRTILDQMGAESLLGQGDMLFLPPGTGYPQRVHGAFVADEEVHAVVEYLKQFGEPEYVEGILDGPAGDGAPQDLFGEAPDAEADPLYDEAVAFVVRTKRVSISSVQRQLRIGYNRAARLVEQMEAAGLVSPMGINGSREVLVAGQPE